MFLFVVSPLPPASQASLVQSWFCLTQAQDAVICRITSVQYSGHLDIPILRWQEAGLEKPSVARPNRLVAAEKSLLNRLLGKLSEPDLAAIRAAWNRHMVL